MLQSLALLFVERSLAQNAPSPTTTSAAPLEPYLLLPEPRAMRSASSIPLQDSRRTVLTPARQTQDTAGLATYRPEDFSKLGISAQSYLEKARSRADARLAKLVPEFIKDEQGTTRYAVYRSPSPLICTLLIAPSLAKQAATLFGTKVWAATPDRNSLYLFPAKPDVVEEFAADLAERYEATPFSASPEFFLIEEGQLPKAVATFVEQQSVD
jgi:hypothetical protein